MNTATDTTNAQRTRAIADAMAIASDAIRSLEKLGITVIAVSASNRRPTLFVDRMPAGVTSVVKRHSPTGMGREVIRATHWLGCQLETMHEEVQRRVVHTAAQGSEISVTRLTVVPRD